MRPKEKALELFYNYESQVKFSMEDCSFTYRGSDYLIAVKRTAKSCALIAVNEIIDKDGYNNDYWNEVKQEIENL